MKFVKYKKYVPEPASEMSMEDLLNALSDHLLQSGFQQQYMDFYDVNNMEQSLEDLRQAIAEALLNSRRPGRRGAIPGAFRNHRQGTRLPRLPRAARSDGFVGQVQLRPPRHP